MLKYLSSFRDKLSSESTSRSASLNDVVTEIESPVVASKPDAQASASPASCKLVLQLRTAATCLPHPDKVHYGGEDAYFISQAGAGALGVADGVGGWAESGINPAEYSRTLMRMACAYVEGQGIFAPHADGPSDVLPRVDPQGALSAAHLNTKVAGSATACIMQLDAQQRTLRAANLGDSGFFVARGGRVVAKTRPLQHYFDCPFQLGAYPEFVEATDTAEMAELLNIPLRPGDIIVAGSDGLWDNCFESEILELLPRDVTAVQAAANRIANMARAHAEDMDFQSPYIKEALAQGLDLNWWDKLLGANFRNGRFQLRQLSGGKIDDITVMVSMVEEVPEAPPPAADVLSPAESFVTVLSQPLPDGPAVTAAAPPPPPDLGRTSTGDGPMVSPTGGVPKPEAAPLGEPAKFDGSPSRLSRNVTLARPL